MFLESRFADKMNFLGELTISIARRKSNVFLQTCSAFSNLTFVLQTQTSNFLKLMA